jgi:hypothetical protein
MKAGLPKLAVALTLPLLLAACANSPLPSLSTGSVAENSAASAATAGVAPGATAPAAPAAPPSDPASRAFQVGSTSARAVKCGYNFDPAKLKSQYLAAEATRGTADLAKTEKAYDISFNGISRGISEKQDYCSEAKSKEIKTDLTRHLAGDYEPRQKQQVAKKEEEGGMFSGFFDAGDDAVDNGPKIGTTEWWEKQKEKAGK